MLHLNPEWHFIALSKIAEKSANPICLNKFSCGYLFPSLGEGGGRGKQWDQLPTSHAVSSKHCTTRMLGCRPHQTHSGQVFLLASRKKHFLGSSTSIRQQQDSPSSSLKANHLHLKCISSTIWDSDRFLQRVRQWAVDTFSQHGMFSSWANDM